MEISNIEFSLNALTKPAIVFIGPPGSGKTEVGKLLAQELNWQFWDTDSLIEQATKITVPGIFRQYGEKTLRLLEKKLVAKFDQLNSLSQAALGFDKNILQANGTVISTGGGLPVYKENYRILSGIGTVIGLYADLDVLAQRALQQGNRPLLQSMNGASQKSKLESLVKERKAVYQQASWTIDTSKLTVAQVVQSIKQELAVKL
jgi:shikimate kinase